MYRSGRFGLYHKAIKDRPVAFVNAHMVLQIRSGSMRTKLLLVDDREDNLLSIETILGEDDYVFVKANSGRNALKILLNEFDFALILMDVKMPNLDGFETA